MPPTSSDHLQFNFISPSPLMVNIDSVKCSPPAQEVPCLPSPAAGEQDTCISPSGLNDTCLPSPAAGSESGYSSYGGSYAGSESTSSYSHHQSHPQHHLQQPLHVSPSQFSNVSPPSSPESDDSVFLPETEVPRVQPPRVTLPPINLKNNTSFTEAELKAITPWRNALIERLLANQARNNTSNLPSSNSSSSVRSETPNILTTQQSPPNQNLFSSSMEVKHQLHSVQSRPGGGRQRQGRGHARGQMSGGPPFHDVSHLTEFEFGSGPAYEGRICHGTTPYIAISGCIKQVWMDQK